MELRHIRYFLAVAEELNFNRAARRLNMAQPPLSQQIKSLEEELGVRLFHRDRRHVEISAAGAAFHARAVEIMALVSLASEEARSSQKRLVGQLNVAIGAVAHYDLLPEIIREFQQHAPEAKLNLIDVRLQDFHQALSSGSVDVCFLYPIVEPGNFLCEQLITEEGVVALPKGHRLARRACIGLADLAHESWLVAPGALNGVRNLIRQAWTKAGITPIIAGEIESIEGRLQMVAAGAGVSMMASAIARTPRPGVRFVRLRDGDLKVPVGLIWRKGARSALLELFLDCSRRAAASLAPVANTCAE